MEMMKQVKITLIVFGIMLAVILLYGLGLFHGKVQTQVYLSHYWCAEENQVMPYGCKIYNNSNYCAVLDCQSIGGDLNGAVCLDLNESRITWVDHAVGYSLGIVAFGCPVKIEKIKKNKYYCNDAWAVNLLTENITCEDNKYYRGVE